MASGSRLINRRPAAETVHEEWVSSKHGGYEDEVKEARISYEEAMERESKYSKQMNMGMLVPPGFPPLSSSQEGPRNSSLAGIKRKAASQTLPEQQLPPGNLQHKQDPPKRVCFQQSPTPLLQYHRKSMQRPNNQKWPIHSSLHRQTPSQVLNNRQCLPQPSQDRLALLQHSHDGQLLYRKSMQQPNNRKCPIHSSLRRQTPSQVLNNRQCSPRPSQDRLALLQISHDGQLLYQDLAHRQASLSNKAPLWCSVCEVACMNAFCLREHREGKKHKAKVEEILGDKSTRKPRKERLWCRECNVPCMNEMALAQHRVGKKHAAQLLKLQAIRINAADGKLVELG